MRKAANVAQMIPDGNTKIHDHPERNKIYEVMAIYALTPESQRRSLAELEKDLKVEFDLDVDGNGSYTRWFLKEYVTPEVKVLPGWFKAEMVDRDISALEVPIQEGENLKKAQAKLEEALNNPEADYAEIATLMRAVQSMRNDFKDTLERFNTYPEEKPDKSEERSINIDISADDLQEVGEEKVQDVEGGVADGVELD